MQNVLKQIKAEFESAITTSRFNGNRYASGSKAKEALIRSQKIINYIHEFIKTEFVRCGISSEMIHPPLGCSGPEIKLRGKLKSKKQDVLVVPSQEILLTADTFDQQNEKIISVNIRSQLSSLAKNIDTLYERTFAEALNLHLCYPKQCLGEVYLIPTHEYDDVPMKNNQVAFKSMSNMEDYIQKFQAVNNRQTTSKDEYKYERVCLLIADFRQDTPKIYNSKEELISDGLIREDSDANMNHLTINGFVENLIRTYTERFGEGILH